MMRDQEIHSDPPQARGAACFACLGALGPGMHACLVEAACGQYIQPQAPFDRAREAAAQDARVRR